MSAENYFKEVSETLKAILIELRKQKVSSDKTNIQGCLFDNLINEFIKTKGYIFLRHMPNDELNNTFFGLNDDKQKQFWSDYDEILNPITQRINALSANTFPMDYNGLLAFMLPQIKSKNRDESFTNVIDTADFLLGKNDKRPFSELLPYGGTKGFSIKNKTELLELRIDIVQFEIFRRIAISLMRRINAEKAKPWKKQHKRKVNK